MLYPFQVRISPVKWQGPLADAPRGLFLRAFELLDECSKSRGDGSCADDWSAYSAPTSARDQRRQMINASSSTMPIPITSTAIATGS
jgi:hypothetical protein